ncbi:MAG: DUF2007 domain-containing protein [Luteolibacter sp.]
MKTVASFSTAEDAHLFRTYLASEGIEAFLRDEFTVQLCWQYSNAIGGVRVVVADEDAEEAAAHYRDYASSLRAGPYPVAPVRAWPFVALISLLIGAPFLLFGRKTLTRR